MSAEAETSNLRGILNRADRQDHEVMSSRLPVVGDDMAGVLALTEELTVRRRPIKRVAIKVEVAGYIERNFLARTEQDGVILAPSKETLIEELTRLFSSLDEQAAEFDAPARPNGKSRGRPNHPLKEED